MWHHNVRLLIRTLVQRSCSLFTTMSNVHNNYTSTTMQISGKFTSMLLVMLPDALAGCLASSCCCQCPPFPSFSTTTLPSPLFSPASTALLLPSPRSSQHIPNASLCGTSWLSSQLAMPGVPVVAMWGGVSPILYRDLIGHNKCNGVCTVAGMEHMRRPCHCALDYVVVLLTMSLHSWLWRGMRWGSIWTAYYTQSEEVVRVPAIHNELRGLIVVRNEMVWYMRNRNSLSQWRNIKAQGKNHDIECGPAAEPFLPPTIDDEQSYKWRYALDICMLYWKVFPYDHTFPLRHWLNWITILFIYRLLKIPTPALLLRRPMNSKLHI